MASPNGPDVIGLLHDKVGYGAFGDHGGHQESVQQVPMVFWSEGLSAGRAPGVPFTTPDVLPTILKAMGIPLTEPMDGRAWNLP
jgi:arylsulfatase A-like enzyme